jgi:hypothetical protein
MGLDQGEFGMSEKPEVTRGMRIAGAIGGVPGGVAGGTPGTAVVGMGSGGSRPPEPLAQLTLGQLCFLTQSAEKAGHVPVALAMLGLRRVSTNP